MNKLQRLFGWLHTYFRKPINTYRPKCYSKKAWFYRVKGKPTLAQQLYLKIGVLND
ncbi:hypothetical protein K7G92_000718 [Pasteurella canis]|uniref:hypothetical protein n=1 Tax=Pasteurella canis TaxID=753 RepID=UPI001E513447|nr:hypothetical protein [Pasteurella canis]HDR0674179.1 hypothetical protein [Pasteurella multocida]UEA17511.1 hypothetical protein K7G92_000718 [Pasteurella canis]HDR0675985.1 hypothetical protein [Pasteurella multocida]HDR0679152.1 hypothetical protein [Pasteurella multocida]HDR0682935.1 hypothetical protein [Pasteurella multocida]